MAQEIIRCNGDQEGMFKTAASHLLEHLGAQSAGHAVLGLCGGRSVVGLLKALKEAASREASNILSRVEFFMVDERLVPLTNEHSNYGGLKKLLFDELLAAGVISAAQLHPFVPDESKPDHGTAGYMAELERFGGRFTAVVLGVGEDGHVAGVFPGHPIVHRPERCFLSFYDSPKPPPERMTASIPLITTAGMCVLLALGEAKRDAFNRFKAHNTDIAECPAVMARQIAQTWIVTDL